ncbi:MAG: hypothetical protein HY074_08185 [Deltaproteobacteria bacterium]|nr:hypothetical protein [Deltaproteobacteria bacterium]
MKIKNLALTAIATLAVVSCSSHPGGITETVDRDLIPGVSIVYSANIDGEIEPCGCRSNPTGGVNRRWNFVQQKVPGEKLIIDSGDLFFQSAPVPPFLEKQWNYQAHVLLTAYNALGVEAMTPGDLDFADGLAPFEKLAKEAKFKIVSANLYYKNSGKRMFAPYVILNKGGKKVAIFGLFDEVLPLPPEIFAKDHFEAATEMVQELRGRADIILALTHEGIDHDMELAKKVTGIDGIFGAHTQSFLMSPEKIGDTLIFQPSFRGQHIGVYVNGTNSMFQIDDRFDSKPDNLNILDKVVADGKAEIARINKETDAELMGTAGPRKTEKPTGHEIAFQTFTQCAQCHTAQYAFYKSTSHFKSFATLVQAKQAANLDCLKCHTVGAQQPGGWTGVNKLVLNGAGHPIDAASFVKSLPNMDMQALGKISKAFVNVQCETCHKAGGGHPMGGATLLTKAIDSSTCVQCHTPDRAPGWYKNGKLDAELVQAKLKSVSCPRIRN